MINKIRYIIRETYQYKIDKLIRLLISLFTSRRPLKQIIIIESHNDFDCNGGAFYDYLIRNCYNEKYTIVWLLKNSLDRKLPQNVYGYCFKKPSIKKDYFICVAKYILADNYIVERTHKDQVIVYCTHGAGGLKNIKGNMIIPDYVNYVLFQSPRYAPIQADQYSMKYPCDKIVYLGYPSHDLLNSSDNNEISKITAEKYDKIVVWMPTFRKKGGDVIRCDSYVDQPLGIPLLSSIDEYEKINSYLKKNNMLLIIKIHPMQDLDNLKIYNTSNIQVLDATSVKKLGIDTYRLMSCSDGLISDYSDVAYAYLQLNRPIAYVLSDAKDYKLGFVVDDISTLMAGPQIYNLDDLYGFFSDILQSHDSYEQRRTELRDYIYEYHDTNNCKRLADFLGL